MLTYEQDPDVVKWGLQLFDGEPYSSCGYYGTIAQNDADHYHGHYYKEDNHYNIECSNVEHDELIALSQLAVEEVPDSSDEVVEHLQASVYQEEWLDHSMRNCNSGHESAQEEPDEPSSVCSSPGEETSYYEEETTYSLELTDQYALDGEVEKRLNQMVPIPHVPRMNGEIPSVDEATLDHQRLLDRWYIRINILSNASCPPCKPWSESDPCYFTYPARLQLYQLVELKVQGDGNCQFRALSDQFYRSPEHHKFVRQQVVNQLESYPDAYEGYVSMAYDEYLKKMSKSGEWGDHVTLQAAADKYGVKIFVITSFKDTCYIEILPNVEKSNRVISLSFWAEVHYNSIYPEGELPSFEAKKKKRWRIFRNKQLASIDEYK